MKITQESALDYVFVINFIDVGEVTVKSPFTKRMLLVYDIIETIETSRTHGFGEYDMFRIIVVSLLSRILLYFILLQSSRVLVFGDNTSIKLFIRHLPRNYHREI